MFYLDEVSKLRRMIIEYYEDDDHLNAFLTGERLVALHSDNHVGDKMGAADDLYNLAFIYAEIGKYGNAIAHYTQSAKIVEAINGESAQLADRLNNLAVCHDKQGNYTEAIQLLNRTVAIRLKIFGETGTDYIDSLYNLANIYYDSGDLHMSTAVHCSITANPACPEPIAADCCNWLGYCYEDEDDPLVADTFFLKALRMKKKLYGEMSEEYISDLFYYAQFCSSAEYNDKAVSAYTKSALLIKKKYSVKHPYYAGALNRMADIHVKKNDIERALKLQLKALRYTDISVGKNHVYYANCLRNIALNYKLLGDYEMAAEFLGETLQIKTKLLGCDNFDYLRDILTLCLIYIQNYEPEKAVAKIKATIENSKDENGIIPEYMQELSQIYKLLSKIEDFTYIYDEFDHFMEHFDDYKKHDLLSQLMKKIIEEQ